jgi:hypothetical protein
MQDTILPTDANGAQELVTSAGFMSVTTIVVPAQVDINGQWEFGVRDIVLTQLKQGTGSGYEMIARQIRHGSGSPGSASVILVGYPGDDIAAAPAALNRYRDPLPGIEGEHHDVRPNRIYGEATTTSDPITIYF